MFEEARDKGFLVLNPSGRPYLIPNTSFSAGMVDLTHPEACEWLKDVLRDMERCEWMDGRLWGGAAIRCRSALGSVAVAWALPKEGGFVQT